MKTILQEIASLQHYNGLERLKDLIKRVNSRITDLETNSVLIYNFSTTNYISATSGLLIVGNYYTINSLVPGDNFTNVGHNGVASYFIATGTTPSVWTNGSSLEYGKLIYQEIFNDTGAILNVEQGITPKLKLTSTNNIFIQDKMFMTGNIYTYINSNNIYLNVGKNKLEIFN